MSFTTWNTHNGVKPRFDKKGDAWALAHRELGRGFNMTDIDSYSSLSGVTWDGQNSFFAEIAGGLRRWAFPAFFDRKKTDDIEFHLQQYSTKAILALCRAVAKTQPVPPKFFIVCGGDAYPWGMYEIDIATGEAVDYTAIGSAECWRRVWEMTGLVETRQELERWCAKQ